MPTWRLINTLPREPHITLPLPAHPTSTACTKPVVMGVRARKAKESLLNDRIDILNRNGIDGSPAGQIFTTVSAILVLVRVGAPVLSALELLLIT